MHRQLQAISIQPSAISKQNEVASLLPLADG